MAQNGPVETLRVVLRDQLSRRLATLSDLDPAGDVVLMAEVMDECTYVPHHLKKIVLVLSAMRHFARALAARGCVSATCGWMTRITPRRCAVRCSGRAPP